MNLAIVLIVLDTNVVSEYFRDNANPRVLNWFVRNPRSHMYLTTITEAELWRGVYRLEDGARRRWLEESIEDFFRLIGPRVLPFDRRAAMEYARLADIRRRQGLGISPLDLQIAAIANSRGMTVATRNVKDFSGMGVLVDNSWE